MLPRGSAAPLPSPGGPRSGPRPTGCSPAPSRTAIRSAAWLAFGEYNLELGEVHLASPAGWCFEAHLVSRARRRPDIPQEVRHRRLAAKVRFAWMRVSTPVNLTCLANWKLRCIAPQVSLLRQSLTMSNCTLDLVTSGARAQEAPSLCERCPRHGFVSRPFCQEKNLRASRRGSRRRGSIRCPSQLLISEPDPSRLTQANADRASVFAALGPFRRRRIDGAGFTSGDLGRTVTAAKYDQRRRVSHLATKSCWRLATT